MSWLDNVLRIFRQKTNAAMIAADDPIEALDLLFRDQTQALQKTRSSLSIVLANEKRLEQQRAQLQDQEVRHRAQASQSLSSGDEKHARLLLGRALAAEKHQAETDALIADVKAQREGLEQLVEEMRAQLETLRLRRQGARTQIAAAKATIQANEALAPSDASGAERALSLENAADKLRDYRARAESLGQLRREGMLDAVGASEFDAMPIDQGEVERELAALKSQQALPN